MKTIAFIGVGVMGKAMVQNLAKQGYTITIYTRTKQKIEDILSDSIVWRDTIVDCIKDKDVIMTMVGFPKDVEEIYFGTDGIIENAKKDAVLMDFTTSSPELACRIETEAKKHELYSLDCPVSGGDTGAIQATLSIMVGGDKNTYQHMLPILQCLGTSIHHVGPAGYGQHVKMTNQIALAGAIAGVSEAITYAKTVGLDPKVMLECISKGAAGSWQMTNMGPRILDHDLNPGFYIKHYIKDMLIAKEELTKHDIQLDVLNTVLNMYQVLQQDGLENLGTQALYQYYEQKNEH